MKRDGSASGGALPRRFTAPLMGWIARRGQAPPLAWTLRRLAIAAVTCRRLDRHQQIEQLRKAEQRNARGDCKHSVVERVQEIIARRPTLLHERLTLRIHGAEPVVEIPGGV